jgi:hypothetical protein
MHGGKGSGAPAHNRNAFKTGLHTCFMKALDREVRVNARRLRILVAEMEAEARAARRAVSLARSKANASGRTRPPMALPAANPLARPVLPNGSVARLPEGECQPQSAAAPSARAGQSETGADSQLDSSPDQGAMAQLAVRAGQARRLPLFTGVLGQEIAGSCILSRSSIGRFLY